MGFQMFDVIVTIDLCWKFCYESTKSLMLRSVRNIQKFRKLNDMQYMYM